MKKNIILYVGGFEMPDKNAASLRVKSNAKILKTLNYKVIFIGLTKEYSCVKKEVHHGFESWLIPYPKNIYSWFNHIISINRVLEVITHLNKNEIRAIICYNFPAIPLYKLQKYCKKNNIFHISDTTEWYSSMNYSFLRKVVKYIDTSLRMKYFQFYSDGIITTSNYLTKFYSKTVKHVVEIPTLFDLNISRSLNEDKKVKFIYAGIPFDKNHPLEKRNLIKDRLDKVVVLFSNVGLNYNNFILNIYGLNEPDYIKVFPEHKSMLIESKNCIKFHGKVSNTIVKEQMLLSDFSVFIRNIDRTIEAGFPTKFSESISMGTPVICNKISCIDKYMIEGKNCFEIDMNSLTKQLKKINFILNLDKILINEMKTFCLQSQMFHYKNYLNRVDVFFKSLINN